MIDKIIGSFKCPICHLSVEIADRDDGKQSLLHYMPACETFIKLDADSYISLVHKMKAPVYS